MPRHKHLEGFTQVKLVCGGSRRLVSQVGRKLPTVPRTQHDKVRHCGFERILLVATAVLYSQRCVRIAKQLIHTKQCPPGRRHA